MTAGDDGPDEAAALRRRRLDLDNEDLRAENARLKASIAEKQDEIMALSDRLTALQRQLGAVHRLAAWGRLRRLNPLRRLMRRLG